MNKCGKPIGGAAAPGSTCQRPEAHSGGCSPLHDKAEWSKLHEGLTAWHEKNPPHYYEGFEALRAWAMDEGHIIQSVRMHEPIYTKPSALRSDVRRALALLDMEAHARLSADSRLEAAAKKLLAAWDMIGGAKGGNKQEAIRRRSEAVEELREALR